MAQAVACSPAMKPEADGRRAGKAVEPALAGDHLRRAHDAAPKLVVASALNPRP